MNKFICLIIICFTFGFCKGQNHVLNGDFEQYSGCPNFVGSIDSALYWFSPNTGTTDYFNECAIHTTVFVPTNVCGYQYAHSGSGYAGFYLYYFPGLSNGYREYIETTLNSPLIANNCYYFEMYVNLAHTCRYTVDNIGAYFSITPDSGINNWLPLTYNSQINNISGNYPDSVSWSLIRGNFIATGGERFLVIGNFNTDAATDTILFNSLSTRLESYIYLDDVSLTPCITEGIDESSENIIENIYPNPFKDKLNIALKREELVEVILYDAYSRKIFFQLINNSTTINTEQLSKGIYFYEVRGKKGVIKKGKITKD